jgi:hypothetical protein
MDISLDELYRVMANVLGVRKPSIEGAEAMKYILYFILCRARGRFMSFLKEIKEFEDVFGDDLAERRLVEEKAQEKEGGGA